MASEAAPRPSLTTPNAPGADPDPNSSSSTLVNHSHAPATPSEPTSPVSPFSASFDPNASTPSVHNVLTTPLGLTRDCGGPLYPITEVQHAGTADAANALWAHRLSASFGAIADQIAAASRELATASVSTPTEAGPSRRAEGSAEVAALAARLDIIERTQERLRAELQQVQAQLARVHGGSSRGSEKGKEGDVMIVEVQEGSQEGTSEFKSAAEIAIEELRKKVDGAVQTIQLDQVRLYARLHNATVTTNKTTIKAPVMANGKAPQNFPSTKGEFEHLTKERYESLLKAYNVPIKGDTAAKREALREFIGLTPAN